MKLTGIIAEYNPLHRGHIYHLREARERTGADGIVCVISGDFTQRGEPALTDKFSRAAMALEAGADLVLELPVRYATASAESFAAGGVEILDRLGAVTDIVCGAEAPDISSIEKAAGILADEPPAFKEILLADLAAGMSFPSARAHALEAILPGSGNLLSSPNNILAVEYSKALIRRESSLGLTTILRCGQAYHSAALEGSEAASASGIRKGLADAEDALAESLKDMTLSDIRSLSARELMEISPHAPVWKQMPEETLNNLPFRIRPDDLSELMRYSLLTARPSDLEDTMDLSPEIASRLMRFRYDALSYTELADKVKTRQITRTRVNRALLHLLLQIKDKEAPSSIPAVRILGLRKGSPAARTLQKSSKIPLITKMADAPEGAFDDDIRASEIYRLLAESICGAKLQEDIKRHPVIL